MLDFRICQCSGRSVHQLFKNDRQTIILGTDNLGMKNLIENKGSGYDQLDHNGKILIEQCVDFLIIRQNDPRFIADTEEYKLFNSTCSKRKNNYITLWSFIYQCIRIPKDSGYDYYLMNYLNHVGLIEHGSGIRCAYYYPEHDIDALKNRVICDETKTMIENWIDE